MCLCRRTRYPRRSPGSLWTPGSTPLLLVTNEILSIQAEALSGGTFVPGAQLRASPGTRFLPFLLGERSHPFVSSPRSPFLSRSSVLVSIYSRRGGPFQGQGRELSRGEGGEVRQAPPGGPCCLLIYSPPSVLISDTQSPPLGPPTSTSCAKAFAPGILLEPLGIPGFGRVSPGQRGEATFPGSLERGPRDPHPCPGTPTSTPFVAPWLGKCLRFPIAKTVVSFLVNCWVAITRSRCLLALSICGNRFGIEIFHENSLRRQKQNC